MTDEERAGGSDAHTGIEGKQNEHAATRENSGEAMKQPKSG